MGHSLQLHFVKLIEDAQHHEFKFKSPDGKWDYVDLKDAFDLYAVFNLTSFYEDLMRKAKWRRSVTYFLIKTDGRVYGDEGYEPTIFSPDDIMDFVSRLEKEISRDDIAQTEAFRYLQPNKRGQIPLTEELQEMKRRVDIARNNGYYFKCLDM